MQSDQEYDNYNSNINRNNSNDSNDSPNTIFLVDNDGLSHYTAYLARGLSIYRDVSLYGFSNNAYLLSGAVNERNVHFCSIEDIMPKGILPIRLGGKLLLIPMFLLNALCRTRDNIVHVQGHLPMFFLFIPILKAKKRHLFWTVHDVELKPSYSGLKGMLEVLLIRMTSQPYIMAKYSDIIIVHALSLKKRLVSRGTSSRKICVIPHFDYRYLAGGVDGSTNNLRPEISDFVLLFGRITPYKGTQILIDAAKIVRKRLGQNNLKFIILGSGKESNFPKVEEQDLEYIHIYNKYIPSSEIPDLFNRALFVVLPYTNAFKYSVSGIIPLAYTFSKPVIVSNVDSLAEYVEHGKTGFIFDVGDSTQLAEYMIELLENNSKCIEMGKNANRKLLHEMSLEKCCKMLNDLYDRR